MVKIYNNQKELIKKLIEINFHIHKAFWKSLNLNYIFWFINLYFSKMFQKFFFIGLIFVLPWNIHDVKIL